MSNNNDWKKRYSFRLTEDDKDVFDFIESSQESNSETIRKLLKFAILHINTEIKHRKENERSEEHTSELQSRGHLVCRLLLEKKKVVINDTTSHTVTGLVYADNPTTRT